MDMDEHEKVSMSSSSSMQSCRTHVSASSSGSGKDGPSKDRQDIPRGPPGPSHSPQTTTAQPPPRNSQPPPRSGGGGGQSQVYSRALSTPARGLNVVASPSGSGTPDAGDGGALRVLVAEDNLVNQKVLLKVLQRVTPNSVVFVANNGQEALQVGKPCCLVLFLILGKAEENFHCIISPLLAVAAAVHALVLKQPGASLDSKI
jgi:CheY-like chemotaxis protein